MPFHTPPQFDFPVLLLSIALSPTQFQNSRLYLVTRNPEPYLPPDARSLVAATNFTVTRSGLEGQLLGLTIQKEQPELEAQKSGLLKQEEDLKVWSVGCGREGGRSWKERTGAPVSDAFCSHFGPQVALADLEKNLLETLASSTGVDRKSRKCDR